MTNRQRSRGRSESDFKAVLRGFVRRHSFGLWLLLDIAVWSVVVFLIVDILFEV